MKERFEGDNRPILIDALKRQELVKCDAALAEAMVDQGELLEFPKGHENNRLQGGCTTIFISYCQATPQ